MFITLMDTCTYTILFGMTGILTSQNIDISLWKPLYIHIYTRYFSIDNAHLMYNAHPKFFHIPFDV